MISRHEMLKLWKIVPVFTNRIMQTLNVPSNLIKPFERHHWLLIRLTHADGAHWRPRSMSFHHMMTTIHHLTLLRLTMAIISIRLYLFFLFFILDINRKLRSILVIIELLWFASSAWLMEIVRVHNYRAAIRCLIKHIMLSLQCRRCSFTTSAKE